jgi:hypothetical protein
MLNQCFLLVAILIPFYLPCCSSWSLSCCSFGAWSYNEGRASFGLPYISLCCQLGKYRDSQRTDVTYGSIRLSVDIWVNRKGKEKTRMKREEDKHTTCLKEWTVRTEFQFSVASVQVTKGLSIGWKRLI